MLLSQRITHLNTNGTDGWEVFLRARSMKAAGLPIVELTIGEHDIRTQADILEAMHVSTMNGHTGYAMVSGTDQLRDTIAKRVSARTGVPTDRDNVLITPGGQSALFAAHIALCDPGDRALYLDPYYATYPGTIRGTGAQDVAIQTHSRDAFLPQQAPLDAAAPGAKSLLINTPNNPSGVVYPKETIEMISGVCQRHDLWLISDEVYDTQIWQGEHVSPRALPGMAERTLVIGSMSKSHAMTGSRCGWIIGPKDVIAHLIHLATHTTYGVPGFIQDAADYALKQGADLEVVIAEPFKRRRALALEVLSQQTLLRVIPPQGAMYLMLDVRETGHSGNSFANLLLESHKIAVMPGESFGHAAAGHIRIAMTVDDDVFVTALQVLCDFAQSLGK